MTMAQGRCYVIAIFSPLDGHSSEVRDILTSIIPEVHEEPGCEIYSLHEDVQGRLVFVESWTNRDLWEQHKGHSTVERILALTKPHLACDVEVIEMYALPAGTTEKGLLQPV